MANHGDKGNVEDFSVSAPLGGMATELPDDMQAAAARAIIEYSAAAQEMEA